uniref:UDP-xylose and UDP-N-acetylglucosamine transporter n=1 Tax=Acrobeloides nanus TaxID=290746 RepID=A0A914C289_9BILA
MLLDPWHVSAVGTLTGCIACMTCVESLAKENPSAMSLLTFATFLFIALEGLFVSSRFLTIPNKIPIRGYIPVVIVFTFVNFINNQALNFHVPVPLHIIFRSGSLLTSLLMNRLVLGRKYSTKKYLSVLAVTVGIVVCTLVNATNEKKSDTTMSLEEAEKHYKEWTIGIIMLTVALIASSYLAILQEKMYSTYGKHPREAMFYIHALGLPFFTFWGTDIYRSLNEFSNSPAYEVLGISLGIPGLWLKLLGACAMQWVCILFVYQLNSQTDSLTVTLIVTLRKFLSLLISVFWFNNTFTFLQWLAAAAVFGGTATFTDLDVQLYNRLFANKPKKEKST